MREPAVGVALLATALVFGACETEETVPQVSYPPGTCEQYCEKSVEIACPMDGYDDVPTCAAQCEARNAPCATPSIIDDYLGCAVATQMVCTGMIRRSSSPECVREGAAYFACLSGLDDSDTTDSPRPVTPPPLPSAEPGEIAFIWRVEDRSEGPYRCQVGNGQGVVDVTQDLDAPGGAREVTISCAVATSIETVSIRVSLRRPDLALGAYPIAPDLSWERAEAGFSLQWRGIDGTGFSVPNSDSQGIDFEGELVLDSSDFFYGWAAGWVTVTFPRLFETVDGVAHGVVDRPGAVSMRFSTP